MTKILIVDDDKQATTLLEKVLTGAGYETSSVNDSTQAIHTALTLGPDLIVLDLMMPDPDGFKVCRMLREYPRFTLTPIIIVTALDDSDSKIVAFGAGADDYLTKPFHIEELTQRVRDLLNKVNS
jgi:DNA-binding response OmpR family regulator